MVAIAQLVEPWIVIPVVVGSIPPSHPSPAGMAELVDAPDLGSGALGVRVQVSFPVPLRFSDYPFSPLAFISLYHLYSVVFIFILQLSLLINCFLFEEPSDSLGSWSAPGIKFEILGSG